MYKKSASERAIKISTSMIIPITNPVFMPSSSPSSRCSSTTITCLVGRCPSPVVGFCRRVVGDVVGVVVVVGERVVVVVVVVVVDVVVVVVVNKTSLRLSATGSSTEEARREY